MDGATAFDRAYVAIRYLLGGRRTLHDVPVNAAPLADALASTSRRARARALALALSEVARALEDRGLR